MSRKGGANSGESSPHRSHRPVQAAACRPMQLQLAANALRTVRPHGPVFHLNGGFT
jgi:hypothetical protein